MLCLLFIKLLVEQENEQVDVDGGPIKELHHGHAFILQLEEILRERGNTGQPTFTADALEPAGLSSESVSEKVYLVLDL